MSLPPPLPISKIEIDEKQSLGEYGSVRRLTQAALAMALKVTCPLLFSRADEMCAVCEHTSASPARQHLLRRFPCSCLPQEISNAAESFHPSPIVSGSNIWQQTLWHVLSMKTSLSFAQHRNCGKTTTQTPNTAFAKELQLFPNGKAKGRELRPTPCWVSTRSALFQDREVQCVWVVQSSGVLIPHIQRSHLPHSSTFSTQFIRGVQLKFPRT